jgi:hypothetical protein
MERERLLNKTSDNISNLIHLMTIHEENLTRYVRGLDIDVQLFSLLSPINTNTNIDTDTDNNITQNTTLSLYQDIINPINDTCPITHDIFLPTDEVILLNVCRHIFKKNSILNWFRRHHNCPVCRVTIL